jgi:hypothetical protein
LTPERGGSRGIREPPRALAALAAKCGRSGRVTSPAGTGRRPAHVPRPVEGRCRVPAPGPGLQVTCLDANCRRCPEQRPYLVERLDRTSPVAEVAVDAQRLLQHLNPRPGNHPSGAASTPGCSGRRPAGHPRLVPPWNERIRPGRPAQATTSDQRFDAVNSVGVSVACSSWWLSPGAHSVPFSSYRRPDDRPHQNGERQCPPAVS